MNTATINPSQRVAMSQVRQQLTDLVERSHFKNETIQITRQDKPVAWIVGNNFIEALQSALADDQSLQDTLEIFLNQNEYTELTTSIEEMKQGGVVKVSDSLFEE